MKRPRCTCGEEAVVAMRDVWLCLEDFQACVERHSSALHQMLEMLRGVRNALGVQKAQDPQRG